MSENIMTCFPFPVSALHAMLTSPGPFSAFARCPPYHLHLPLQYFHCMNRDSLYILNYSNNNTTHKIHSFYSITVLLSLLSLLLLLPDSRPPEVSGCIRLTTIGHTELESFAEPVVIGQGVILGVWCAWRADYDDLSIQQSILGILMEYGDGGMIWPCGLRRRRNGRRNGSLKYIYYIKPQYKDP